MSQKPRLRIIVLNYNRAYLTSLCVKSILLQSYQPLDIVVVDNNSMHSEVIKLYETLPENILLIENEQNLGYSAGNNVGAKVNSLPCPDYIMILNNDIELHQPDTCEKLVKALHDNQHIVAATPLTHTEGVELKPEVTIQVRRVPDFLTELISGSWWLRRLPRMRRFYDLHVYADQRPYPNCSVIECETINGSCFIIDAKFLEEIGYLDEETFLYHEELILGWQIKDHSKTACLVTSTVVNHMQGATTGHGGKQFRLDMKLEMLRSELHYCRRYLKSSQAMIFLLFVIRVIDLISLAMFSRFKRFLP